MGTLMQIQNPSRRRRDHHTLWLGAKNLLQRRITKNLLQRRTAMTQLRRRHSSQRAHTPQRLPDLPMC
jgi:hypothetical protein